MPPHGETILEAIKRSRALHLPPQKTKDGSLLLFHQARLWRADLQYQSYGDPGSVAFVVGSYITVVLLFSLLRKLEGADRETRGKIHAAVWVLTTLLTAMFASRVAPLMPQFVAVQCFYVLRLLLELLFPCLRTYERAPPRSPARDRARSAVRPLTTLLAVGFAWRVAALMP
ncbi:hypothetical protein EJB05_46268, partial [Eragrostis curvula]